MENLENNKIQKFEIGQKIKIEDGLEYEIEEIKDSVDLGNQFGVPIKRNFKILFLDGNGQKRKGAYSPELDVVLLFKNTDEQTIKHELIHGIEYQKEKSPELVDFYEKAKDLINEDSFSGDFVSFNFRKNISEFIADGYTKEPFISALKKEGLYEDFLEKTKYLFDN